MAQDPRLGLPYISASQAQKEVTHNEAILMLGRLVQASVKAITAIDPQGGSPSPAEGDAYIVIGGSPSPTGDFVGHTNEIAYWVGESDGEWEFVDPVRGMLVYVDNLRAYWAWDGGTWVQAIALP